MTDPVVVRVVCTGRGSHRRHRIRSAIMREGDLIWREPLVDVSRAAPQTQEADRLGFECVDCGTSRVFLRGTLVSYGEKIIAATPGRRKMIELDLSLLP